MKSSVMIVIALTLGMLTNAAMADSEQHLRSTIQTAISQTLIANPSRQHPTQAPTSGWWRSLGPETPDTIIAMYNESQSLFEKVKLLEALQYFDNRNAVSFLKVEASSTKNKVLRIAALRSLGSSQGEKATEFLSGYLNHKDPHTRLAAAESLQSICDPQAKQKVAAFLKVETSPWVVSQLRASRTDESVKK